MEEIVDLLGWLGEFICDDKWQTDAFEDVLIILKNFSLLQGYARRTEDRISGCYITVHPLVKDWISLRTVMLTSQQNTVIAAVLFYRSLVTRRDGKYLKMMLTERQSILPHLLAQKGNCEDYLVGKHGRPLGQTLCLVYVGKFMPYFAVFLRAITRTKVELGMSMETEFAIFQ